MIKIDVKSVSQISPEQSVICIVGNEEIPSYIMLSRSEKEYAEKRLKEKDEYVFINSYFKCTYIVPLNTELTGYKLLEDLRKKASLMKKLIKSNNHSEIVIASDGSVSGAEEAFAEGLILSIYSFSKYKTKEEEKNGGEYPSRILIYDIGENQNILWLRTLCEAVYMTRDLINEPPNYLNAEAFSGEIKKIGDSAGFSVEVFNKEKIEALNMGGILAVNRGSVDPPVFCILEWKPQKSINSKPVVLIGKGIMYDTGGLNIKTGEYMSQMKTDMAGAATVAGIMYVISKCELPVHVIGLLPATDNRPGGNAYTQGDIIRMFDGSTVEIGNTDAEGRLLLADAISYACNYAPELIITIATLTGSAAMTFGNQAIAVMGNADEKYFKILEEAGNDVYERIACLPFWDEYSESLKSDVADIKNNGGREAGAITAGKFLESFAKYPLIHLDIAGTGVLKKDDFYRIKEGPGSGLRLLAVFLKKLASGNVNNK
ncbi:MAG TPA: leucyl aminopeptidase family protein [Bacteroidales bacterium]|nr:leucyl aminopeptidase family protein [Bacteroidales bacterium]HOU95852.1 leucyl aminopeptidase family protein [Bacteroidales bacterium]HQG36989.1 leucyl aminopeptidase family protein [Bacteroidales bacterium]HQG52625.1 leucyl aminopeptidase family protein [Bacteroidales bacterium]HQJ20369.1 leucyl aminopeptidase family protein [Bacteroidales bacterium]